MAVKEKNKEQKSRIWEILSKDYKWESYVFLLISLVVLILGTLILTGTLSVKENMPVIGSYPKPFAWALVVASSFGVLYAIYPFFKPAFPELKRVKWLSKREFLADSIRVFMFLIIFALLFVLYDFFLMEIWSLIVK